MQTHAFHATDFVPLTADLFHPDRAPRSAVLVAPAMGVPRRFYRGFAEHLAARGHLVLVPDYRGIGGSAPRDIRRMNTALHHWGERDLTAATRELRALAGADVPLRFVGHSVGGQLMGMVEGVPFERALLVASQSGYWGHWSGGGRAAMYSLWHAVLPTLVKTHGKLPMKLLGSGEDVPAGVATEWARWGRHPGYLEPFAEARGFTGYGAYSGDLLQLAFSDDGYAPVTAVDALGDIYRNARRARAVVHPGDVGLKQVGHFGFFRPNARDTLWRAADGYLEQGEWTLPWASRRGADLPDEEALMAAG
jgi:predicted alpha/beta hydrolase